MNEEPKNILKKPAHGWWRNFILFMLVTIAVFLVVVVVQGGRNPGQSFSGTNYTEPWFTAGLFAVASGIIVVALAICIRNRSVWHKVWNEPRQFFGWLTLFSLIGIASGYDVFLNNFANPYPPSPVWLRETVLTFTAIALAYFVLGFVCMVLAWIPPVRRLLAWLLQRRFYVLACLVTLVALFYAEEDWRGKRAWDNYRREWEAKGEHFDFASIVPPPVPDDQNFALTPIVYSSYGQILDKHGNRIHPDNTNLVDRLAMSIYRGEDYGDTNLNLGSWQKAKLANLKPWQDYYRNPKATKATPAKPNAVVTNEFPVSPQPQTPAADVLLALSKYDSTLEELREAAKLPYARFPLEYNCDEPGAILLPHLAKNKVIAQFVNLRATAELEADQPEKALADLKLGFRCNDAIRNEPFLIDHLVRIAGQTILMQPVWQGLAEQKWSDAQIAELESELAKQDYLADFHQAMRGERDCCIATIDWLRRNRNYQNLYGEFQNESGNRNPVFVVEMLYAVGWYLVPDGQFYQTELAHAQMHERWNFPAVDLQNRLVSPTANNRLAKGANEAMQLNSVRNILVRMLYPALEKACKKFAIIQAQVDLARVACALERYRLAHGNYPDALDALAPQFIAEVPHDIINGQPLKYRREANGRFILYSVGWNEKDDGGTVVVNEKSESHRVDTDQGDWVWRYPAKE